MKKDNQSKALSNIDLTTNKDLSSKKVVTTDVNILLNRVKLDKKNDLKKKILFLSIILIILSCSVAFVII